MKIEGIKIGISTCRALVVAFTRAGVFNEQSENFANMLRIKIKQKQKRKSKTDVWESALARYYSTKAKAEANEEVIFRCFSTLSKYYL